MVTHFLQLQVDSAVNIVGVPPFFVATFGFRNLLEKDVLDVSSGFELGAKYSAELV